MSPRLLVHELRHGTVDGYVNHGCRCDECRVAAMAYQRELQAAPCANGCGRTVWGRFREGAMCVKCRASSRTIPLDELHGTETGYSRGCRCDLCREAANAAKRRRRRTGTVSTHSWIGYSNGCRCDVCREGHRLRWADLRARARVAREDRAAEVRLRGEERVAELEKEANRPRGRPRPDYDSRLDFPERHSGGIK